ncbi:MULTISPECIES: hypothetical protein [Sediminimonas]|uniref:hypothetical protein n=1 Tax=Sediminimonas TaxID=659427 RepID=UPI00041F6359|nr:MULTISPECIES: hypothetical protein [Sediminimonas]MDR9484538.1 hypothetical protein [Sediminimonas sp.]
MYDLTPTTDLTPGEEVIASFHADRPTYWRDMATMAAVAMAIGMAILWAMGNPHIWTGAVGGLAAVALRAFYIASDEVNVRWDLTNRRVLGPQGRAVRLGEIKMIRTLGSAVQLVTHTGDKHLLKYQADRNATKARIERAIAGGRG